MLPGMAPESTKSLPGEPGGAGVTDGRKRRAQRQCAFLAGIRRLSGKPGPSKEKASSATFRVRVYNSWGNGSWSKKGSVHRYMN